MTVKTINHTRRRKIERKHVRIHLRQSTKAMTFDADLGLSGYRFTSDASVFVEAYRQTTWMRFEFGKVGAPLQPADRTLSLFDTPEDIKFRVKVVDQTGEYGKILGEADKLRPTMPGEKEDQRVPLLPVKPDGSLGNELARVEFDPTGAVRLLVNSAIPDWKDVASSDLFASMVYPHVLRRILTRALLEEEESPDAEDSTDWRAKWLRFATRLPGMHGLEQDSEDAVRQEWIEEAVKTFARKHGLLAKFSKEWRKREGEQ